MGGEITATVGALVNGSPAPLIRSITFSNAFSMASTTPFFVETLFGAGVGSTGTPGAGAGSPTTLPSLDLEVDGLRLLGTRSTGSIVGDKEVSVAPPRSVFSPFFPEESAPSMILGSCFESASTPLVTVLSFSGMWANDGDGEGSSGKTSGA